MLNTLDSKDSRYPQDQLKRSVPNRVLAFFSLDVGYGVLTLPVRTKQAALAQATAQSVEDYSDDRDLMK